MPLVVFAAIFLTSALSSSAVDLWTKDTALHPTTFSDMVNVSDLKVRNQAVCLQDGSNCANASVFTYGMVNAVDFTSFNNKANSDDSCTLLNDATHLGVVQNTTSSYNDCVQVSKPSVGINKVVTVLTALPSTFCAINFTEGIAISSTC